MSVVSHLPSIRNTWCSIPNREKARWGTQERGRGEKRNSGHIKKHVFGSYSFLNNQWGRDSKGKWTGYLGINDNWNRACQTCGCSKKGEDDHKHFHQKETLLPLYILYMAEFRLTSVAPSSCKRSAVPFLPWTKRHHKREFVSIQLFHSSPRATFMFIPRTG